MHNRGFTIFFAVLVGGLALSVGIAIYDLTVRELTLSSTVTQSQYALFAADSGAECALYWDGKYGGSNSAFATSSLYTPSSSVVCNNQTISTTPSDSSSTAATTTFSLSFSPQPYCATVTVAKYSISGTPFTTVVSQGFNTCVAGAPLRLERALQVSY